MSFVDPMDRTDLTASAAHRFITEEVGVPLRFRRFYDAAQTEIERIKMGYNYLYSRRAILKWLESQGIPIDWKGAEEEIRRKDALRRYDQVQTELAAVNAETV